MGVLQSPLGVLQSSLAFPPSTAGTEAGRYGALRRRPLRRARHAPEARADSVGVPDRLPP